MSAENARPALERLVTTGDVAGAQYVAVGREGTLVDLAVGSADPAHGRPMEASTLQLAFSVTKAVTSIAAMRLVADGQLSLDTPLSDLFDAHPYGRALAVRHLLAHTAGIANAMPLDWFVVEGEPLDRDARLHAAIAKSPELVAAPGARYGYTNLAYWLLEKVVERAAGRDFGEYVLATLFEPLGARAEVSFELPPPERTAIGLSPRWSLQTLVLRAMTSGRYWGTSTGRWRAAQRLLPHGRAYGGLFTTARALAALLGDLVSEAPRVLPKGARETMFADVTTTGGRSIRGGLGWVRASLDGEPYVGKQGGGLGFHGNVRVYPRRGIATVLLANRTEVSTGPIDRRTDRLDRALLGP